jgi:hypothetical protein
MGVLPINIRKFALFQKNVPPFRMLFNSAHKEQVDVNPRTNAKKNSIVMERLRRLRLVFLPKVQRTARIKLTSGMAIATKNPSMAKTESTLLRGSGPGSGAPPPFSPKALAYCCAGVCSGALGFKKPRPWGRLLFGKQAVQRFPSAGAYRQGNPPIDRACAFIFF